MLILNRRLGERILCGYDLNKSDPEGTSDVILKLQGVGHSLSDPKVFASVIWYDDKGKVEEQVEFDSENHSLDIGDLTIKALSVRASIYRGKSEPVVEFGFSAPNNYKIVREEVEIR